MRKQKGFSLIELLLVVAVILIISAIAVPSFLRSREAANESSAVGSLHDIETAQVAYSSTYPTLGFALNLSQLGPGFAGNANPTASNAILLDIEVGCPTGVGAVPCLKGGYNLTVTTVAPPAGDPLSDYSANANPVQLGQSGTRYFYVDPSGVLRYNASALATVNDSAVQ